jgi:replicative DNA helicase
MANEIFNSNIEKAVLASLLYEPSLVEKYSVMLKSTLFYLPVHKKMMINLLQAYQDEKIIDELLLRSKLDVQDEQALIEVLATTPLVKLDDYLEVLQDLALKREVGGVISRVGESIDAQNGAALQAQLTKLTQELNDHNITSFFSIGNINTIEEKESEFICKGWLPIPKRTVSIIAAPGGTGKSWLILQLVMRAIHDGEVGRAFLWLSEDPKEITKHRFNRIYTDVLHYTKPELKGQIDISDSPTIQFLYENQRTIEVSALFYQFKTILDPYDLIVLDPLIAFYGTDENNNAHARRFMQLFTDWANRANKTIIFIHHSTKNTTQSRGASAFVDAVRLVYEVDKLKNKEGEVIDSSKRIIKLTKDNYGASKLTDGYSFERTVFPIPITFEEEKSRGEMHPDF